MVLQEVGVLVGHLRNCLHEREVHLFLARKAQHLGVRADGAWMSADAVPRRVPVADELSGLGIDEREAVAADQHVGMRHAFQHVLFRGVVEQHRMVGIILDQLVDVALSSGFPVCVSIMSL